MSESPAHQEVFPLEKSGNIQWRKIGMPSGMDQRDFV